jgi:hypothetical protein
MKTQQTPDPDYQRTNLKSVMRITAFVTLVALIGIPLFSSSLASATSERSRALPMTTLVRQGAAVNSKGIFRHFLNAGKQVALLPLSPALAETINIFAADCTTPKTEFFLGETVCAKTDGVAETDRFVNWCVSCPTIDYGGPTTTAITTNPQNFLYTPAVTGSWKATIADPSDSSILPNYFNVNPVPPLATYGADCMTPKSTFNLGDTVCARAVGFAGSNNRFVG